MHFCIIAIVGFHTCTPYTMNVYLTSLILSAIGVVTIMIHLRRKARARALQPERDTRIRKKPRKPRVWCNPYLSRRDQLGVYSTLLQELRNENPITFKNYLRIEKDLFDEMVIALTPHLTKPSTNFRDNIPVGLKLACTLRILATGDSLKSAHYTWRTGHSTISKFLPQVCQAIIDVYSPIYMKLPNTTAEWLAIADDNLRLWNYPNCLGSIDGRHVRIRKPPHSGSLYYNYKGYTSIILMAIADGKYRFIYVNIGAEGSAGDSGCWRNTKFHEQIENGEANIPDDKALPNQEEIIMPYHFVGDNAFAMRTWLITPYTQHTDNEAARTFNYRLSRQRRIVENTFGILVARFRILQRAMDFTLSTNKLVTMACCVMHNMCINKYPPREKDLDKYNEEGKLVEAGEWREGTKELDELRKKARKYSEQIKQQRNVLAGYFMGKAQVPWQRKSILHQFQN